MNVVKGKIIRNYLREDLDLILESMFFVSCNRVIDNRNSLSAGCIN